MPRYRYQHDYRSSLGIGVTGDEVDLPEALADHINRDSPGTLAPLDVATERALTRPPADRMSRGGKRRNQRGTNRGDADREGGIADQGPITRDGFQAMRDEGTRAP